MTFFYKRNKKSGNTGILKIILIYIITGGLWILFSDKIITRFTTNIDVLTRIATAKGWMFILVTSLLLYTLIRKYAIEKKETEENLHEVEDQVRKLSRAVEQNPATIVITNLSGCIEYVNPKFVETSGFSFEEVKGKTPSVLKSGSQSNQFYKDLWDTISSGNEWRGEFHNMKKDGTLYWESASISAIRNNTGQMTHFLAIKEDITEKKIIEEELIKAKERAEESDKLKSEFLAQMSHEIRTPLNVILSYNSFLKDELADHLDEEQLNAFAAVNSAGRRLFRTIDLILNMAELQTGKIDIRLGDVNVYYVLKGLTKEFEHAANEKNLQINCLSQCDSPPIIMSDEYIISEVFQNIIDNAIKYTIEGRIDVNVFTDTNNKCCVSVKDTGIGISDEYIEKIFLPFLQEESGYSRKYEGNGLGLALVKNYLKLINADIKVVSEKGVGSNFIVNFN